MIDTYNIYFVLEFDPWKFENDLEDISGEDFHKNVFKVLDRNGIKNIKRLEDYAYLSVKISEIVDEDLEKFIHVQFKKEIQKKVDLKEVQSFYGGIVIENIQDKKASIHHTCCGLIADYKYWLPFLEQKSNKWQRIWLGHPWIFGKIENDRLYLTQFLECDEKDLLNNIDLKYYEFDLIHFKDKFNKALNELDSFKKRIVSILEKNKTPFAEKIAEKLIQNH